MGTTASVVDFDDGERGVLVGVSSKGVRRVRKNPIAVDLRELGIDTPALRWVFIMEEGVAAGVAVGLAEEAVDAAGPRDPGEGAEGDRADRERSAQR